MLKLKMLRGDSSSGFRRGVFTVMLRPMSASSLEFEFYKISDKSVHFNSLE